MIPKRDIKKYMKAGWGVKHIIGKYYLIKQWSNAYTGIRALIWKVVQDIAIQSKMGESYLRKTFEYQKALLESNQKKERIDLFEKYYDCLSYQECVAIKKLKKFIKNIRRGRTVDVKSLLEKYTNTDKYAKKIYDKLLAQVERIEKEKLEVFKWNKRLLNRIAKENEILNKYVIACTLLLAMLQLMLCEYLGFLPTSFEPTISIVVINVCISFALWMFIKIKMGNPPQISYSLILDDEIEYLNAILKDKENIKIKEYRLICKSNHNYIYDQNHNCLKIVDEYVTDKDNQSIYSYQYYQIREICYSNKGAPNCNVLEESFVAIEKTFYSQEWTDDIYEKNKEKIK